MEMEVILIRMITHSAARVRFVPVTLNVNFLQEHKIITRIPKNRMCRLSEVKQGKFDKLISQMKSYF